MKLLSILISLALMAYLTSCVNNSETHTKESIAAKTTVEVVSVSSGVINNELTLFGITIYLIKNMVTAPIPSFISKVNVRLGDHVHKGDILYVLESKESRALGNNISEIDSAFSNFGILKVKASTTGVISTLDKQQAGDYVLEGTQLCTIAESSDLVYQINVPYEYTAYTKAGSACAILLPDNSKLTATFIRALATMNPLAQTQSILAKANKSIILPENMIVKVVIQKGTQDKKQLLPKSCVLSDEMMKEFWVMKIMNDSVAIKTHVTIGNRNETHLEVLSPKFTLEDRIISEGNYGLPDTAMINIHK